MSGYRMTLLRFTALSSLKGHDRERRIKQCKGYAFRAMVDDYEEVRLSTDLRRDQVKESHLWRK
jgi:hypothetical protein